MKQVAEKREAIVAIPPVVKQIQIEVPVRSITIQYHDVAVIVRVQPMYKISSTPLFFEYSQN